MNRLIMTIGLPASGKSTWSRNQVQNSQGKIKRVNKDDMRAMIDEGIWSYENENGIVEIRNLIVKYYLLSGYDVIVDDTNLTPNHEKALRKIAEEFKAEFIVKSFAEVPLSVCLARNALRDKPVPESAIIGMQKYIDRVVKKYPSNKITFEVEDAIQKFSFHFGVPVSDIRKVL